MKNEQVNNQTGKQAQDVKNPLNKQPGMQQGKNEDSDLSMARPGTNSNPDQQQAGSSQQKQGSANSNISVDNEGKIGKAHDQWDNNKRNMPEQKDQNNTRRASNDKTEPEIDTPVYEPEKTEKKIPQMNGKNSNNK